jgi:hypothetical protein
MSKKQKAIRLWTNPTYKNTPSAEYIEIHENKVMFWKCVEDGEGIELECSFPCDVEFVASKFQESGREFDQSKLPEGTVLYPYGC